MSAATTINRLVNTAIRKTTRVMSAAIQQTVPYSPHNPFLEGVFAPVKQESFTTDLKVTGTIPAALNGVLLRMGPNPLEVTNPATYNWFVGDGMVHALRLQHGKALWYKSRFVGVDNVNVALGRPIAAGPRRGPSDVVNTNIIGHAGKLWALVEAGAYPVAMDQDLNTLFHGLFNSDVNLPFTAHPHVDPDSGELHAICYDALQRHQVYYVHIDQQGQLKKRLKIPVQHGPMMHDCAMTQSKMLILDLPITFSLSRLLKGAQLPYSWNLKHQARVGLLPKQGNANDIRWFEVDPCFIFHTCNAYDLDNGDVVMDAVVHDKSFEQSIQGPIEQQGIRFERWVFEHATGQVQRQVISNIPQEFPRLDERLTGKPYRYAYAISVGQQHAGEFTSPDANVLLRHDLNTGETIQQDYGDNYTTGEVIFLPRHATAKEDEGWLISYVHALDNGPSRIVIIDAQQIGKEPQAIIELPVRVPLGFHTNWVAGL